MRTEKEILEAIKKIKANKELTYGYKQDIYDVLSWVLGEEAFDGLEK